MSWLYASAAPASREDRERFDAQLDEPIPNPFLRLVRPPTPRRPGVVARRPPPGWLDDETAAKRAMRTATAINMGVPT